MQMKKLAMLIVMLFLVKVKLPLGNDLIYKHVKHVEIWNYGTTWKLILEDGREAYVPAMFALVEEEKVEDK